MTVIQVQNLSKSFKQFKALNKVNLEVKKGEIHGFIGPNGAGKSTTIRLLLGMLKADAGDVAIFRKDAWNDAVEIHEDVAYIPGEAKLWPNLTGGQVIDLLLEMRKKKADQNLLRQLMTEFEFDPSKKCREYSKGNLQKILIIAAFATEADLYILDEPTSGLDPLMERKFQTHLLQLKAKGKTILLSSHLLSEVERLCDSVSIIRQGEIIESGTLDDLRHLRRMHFEVETTTPIQGLESIPGVHDTQLDGNLASFQVDTESIQQIIQLLSRYEVLELKSLPPKLEDLFMHYYEDSVPEVTRHEK